MDKNALWFAATATAFVIGAAVAILIMKDRVEKKYRKIADEEIESVKKAFERSEKAEEKPTDKPSHDILEAAPSPQEEELDPDIHVISPAEFNEAEREDYGVYAVTYYAGNGVFTDDNDDPLDDEDWEAMVGADIVKRFGEFENDRVCIRNDKKRAYYEVLYDDGSF